MSDKLIVSAGQSSIAGRKTVNEDSSGIRIRFWQVLFILSAILNIILLYFLTR